jgi:Ca2+-binding EF-hand superfamily protein
MHRLLAVWPILALTFSFGTTATADDAKGRPAPPELAKLVQGSADNFIKRFDKNNDGYLTKDELPPRLAAMFDKLDKNGDGRLDKQEVAEMLQVLRKRLGTPAEAAKNQGANQPDAERIVKMWLERMDTNKDGKISKDEAQGPLAKGFERLDTNKDGYLDKTELRRAAEQLLAARKATSGGTDGKGPGKGRDLTDFDALDRNADGRLTREELKGTPYYDQFDKIDANKDGKIDKKEFEKYLHKQGEKKDS